MKKFAALVLAMLLLLASASAEVIQLAGIEVNVPAGAAVLYQQGDMVSIQVCQTGTLTVNAMDLEDMGISRSMINVMGEEYILQLLMKDLKEEDGYAKELVEIDGKTCLMVDMSAVFSVDGLQLSRQLITIYGTTLVMLQSGDSTHDPETHVREGLSFIATAH